MRSVFGGMVMVCVMFILLNDVVVAEEVADVPEDDARDTFSTLLILVGILICMLVGRRQLSKKKWRKRK